MAAPLVRISHACTAPDCTLCRTSIVQMATVDGRIYATPDGVGYLVVRQHLVQCDPPDPLLPA